VTIGAWIGFGIGAVFAAWLFWHLRPTPSERAAWEYLKKFDREHRR
jgi:hypothetical protein